MHVAWDLYLLHSRVVLPKHALCLFYIETSKLATNHTCTCNVCFTVKHCFLVQPFFWGHMQCKVCGNDASFRCRAIGQPFLWWCLGCYTDTNHEDLPHDLEYPIMCFNCGEEPAGFRVQSVHGEGEAMYWCYNCYERVDHPDGPHHIHDLDKASDEDEDEDAKWNEGDEVHHEELDNEHGDSASQRSGSPKSWTQVMQPQDDASSCYIDDECSSNLSFMLSYAVVGEEDEDAQSCASFQMVGDTSSTTAPEYRNGSAAQNPQQQEPQQEQQLDEQQQQHQQQQLHEESLQHEQLDDQQKPDEKAKQRFNLGEWQEEHEMELALALSLSEVAELDQATSSSSSSSKSSSTAAAATPHQGQIRSQQKSKLPRKALADHQKPTCNKNPKLPDFKPTRLQPIQEPVGEVHASQYVASSGCMETFFTQDESGDAISWVMHRPCPMHGLNYKAHCQACANHQHMVDKQKHEMAEQQAIEWSFHKNYLVWMDGQPRCSKHHGSPMEWCQTCQTVVSILDEKAEKADA